MFTRWHWYQALFFLYTHKKQNKKHTTPVTTVLTNHPKVCWFCWFCLNFGVCCNPQKHVWVRLILLGNGLEPYCVLSEAHQTPKEEPWLILLHLRSAHDVQRTSSPLPWFVLISVYFYWYLISMIFTVYNIHVPHCFPMILPGFFSLPPNKKAPKHPKRHLLRLQAFHDLMPAPWRSSSFP